MTGLRLHKAHGLGNDFLLAAAAEAPPDHAELARRLCARHLGVGADGLIFHSREPDGVRMELRNADGSEAEISGNGLRCLAALAVAEGWAAARHVVRTAAGARAVEVTPAGGQRYRVATDLGAPTLASGAIPMILDPPLPVVLDHPLPVAGRRVLVTATSMGNPHCTLFLESVADDELVATVGPALERHPAFPRRTNVEFATVVGPRELRVRFWERGVGPTSASGTGAAAAAVAAMLTGRAERSLRVVCDGGVLEVEWPAGGEVRQVGEVEILFEGRWLSP